MNDRDFFMARRVAEAVAAAGGRTFYVGGFVRDRLLGRENKDIDIEVHGIEPQVLENILDNLGGRTAMGASFRAAPWILPCREKRRPRGAATGIFRFM